MDIISVISERWLEFAVAVYLVGMILYGHHKGFIRLVVSVVALVISLITVHLAVPYIINWIKHNTPIYENVKSWVEETAGLDEILSNMMDGEAHATMEKAAERTVIETLRLPEQMKRLLLENNNGEVYDLLGVGIFRDYVSSYLAGIMIRAAVSAILFLCVFLLLHVAVAWLDLIARLPILSGLNQIAGAILGGVEALFFIWIFFLFLTAVSGTEIGTQAMEQLNGSKWLSWLYQHNLLSYFALGIFRSIL